MMKMIVADNSEINRSIIYSMFASQYELIQTESSEDVFKYLVENSSEVSVLIISEAIAKRLSSDCVKTLSAMRVFDYIPVIMIINKDSFRTNHNISIPFSDVISSPVNPCIIKKRVANLAELFTHKKELEELVKKQTKKIIEQNKRLQTQQKKINTINNDMLDTLSTMIEYRDVESGKHIHRIRKFTEVLLRTLADKYPKYNLTEEKIELITSASSIHDIGKIAIPDSILLSPHRLTYDEFRIMKQHTIKGCEILEQLDGVEKNEYFRYCYDICRYHHEKWDGLGYPDGLVGDQIPIWAQVVSVADCYDALTSERPYKAAFSHEQAVEMIRNGVCGAFSDEMMECFGIVLPKFKELAIEYADNSYLSRSVNNNPHKSIMNEDHLRDVYLKMDRNNLIDIIEYQKKLMSENQKREREVLYKTADYVFEFDVRYDTMHERKGSIKSICGYVPKNYEEAVNILSDCCSESYKNRFIRTFRITGINKAIDNDTENLVMECLMDLGSGGYSAVRCSMIPILENDEITRIFLVMTELHESVINKNYMSDQDAVTGLWNLNGIKKEVDDYIENSGKNGFHALILIDIDDFKKLNRQTNYKFGSDVLCDISEILKNRIKYGNILGRIEDDNFLVFLNDCPDVEQRMELLEDIFRCLHKTYDLKNAEILPISASMGIALYPQDGTTFDELFNKASKAVDITKLNGKNMYLFYNKSMNESWEINKYDTDVLVKSTDSIDLIDNDEYFIPVVDSACGQILSYDMVEFNGKYLKDTEKIIETVSSGRGITAFSLNSISRLAASLYSLKKANIAVPYISIFTLFDGKDHETVLTALGDIFNKYPIDFSNICIMLSHEMIDKLTVNELKSFVSTLKSCGFKIGIYNVGNSSININCLIDNLFDRVMFAGSFLQAFADGIYNISVLYELIKYFAELGAYCIMPGGTDEELIAVMKNYSSIAFGIHKNDIMSLDDFKTKMQNASTVMYYPIIGHEHTSIVPNEKMYDEILIQTKSFILEWMPRFDRIKLSGSFQKMYGYVPQADDFVRNIREISFIHPDDIGKLLEKMNSARSDISESEAFIRVFRRTDESFVWNRVHFVTMRNISQIPVKILAVFTDISDEREGILNDKTRERTDFITNLYNKRATENKIKNYLYDEGSSLNHAFIMAEICGFEIIERELGAVFANAVLKEVAQNIRELFRDSDIIGRSSGNRFIIFVKGINSVDKIREKSDQICKIINNKYQSEAGDIAIFGKAGISLFPNDGTTYDELYAAAVRALYFAKHNIKCNSSFANEFDNSKKLLHN